MTAPVAWIAHSEFERRKTAELLRQFEERDTVDELGIGTIRDAISDLLFPGTSIIQTRARYFLFIPWMYQSMEKKEVSSSEIEARARQAELRLIPALLDSEDPAGTIGRLAKANLKTLPSAIYWQGLARWGIRLYRGNRSAYHASLDSHYRRMKRELRAEDGDPIDALIPNWHRNIPLPPADFPQRASFLLERKEAEYLAERIRFNAGASLLNFLISECDADALPDEPWGHPDYATFPERHKRELQHARTFSEIMNGGAILYNLILAELSDRDDRVRDYRERFRDWAELVARNLRAYRQWRLPDFWLLVGSVNPRIPLPARAFVEHWVDLVLRIGPSVMLDNPAARKAIADRERAIKRGLARVDNRRAREVWRGDSGMRPIEYRWSAIVRQLITDIQEGLDR